MDFFSESILLNLVKWREIDTCNAICQAKRAKTFNVNPKSKYNIACAQTKTQKSATVLHLFTSTVHSGKKRIMNKEDLVPNLVGALL